MSSFVYDISVRNYRAVHRKLQSLTDTERNRVLNTGCHPMQHTDDIKMWKLLIAHKTDVNRVDCYNWAPLQAALITEDAIKFLLENKADPNITELHSDRPLLHEYVASGRFSTVKLLLEHKADPNVAHYGDGSLWHYLSGGRNTALHLVRDLDIAKLLVEHGADPNIRNSNGRLPFQMTCEWKDTSINEYLLNLSSNIHTVVHPNGRTLLHISAISMDSDMLKLVLNKIIDELK